MAILVGPPSASVVGLQNMLNTCYATISNLQLKFNCAKSFCICFGLRHKQALAPMTLGNDNIAWSTSIKYLGIIVKSGYKFMVDFEAVKRKYYMACNTILCNSVFQTELLRLQLLETYCLPILTYCVAALDITRTQLKELNACWNMIFRKIFGFNKWESVRCFIAGLGRLDFEHIYYWQRLKFLKNAFASNNSILLSIVHMQQYSEVVNVLCYKCCLSLDMPFGRLKDCIFDMFKTSCS